MKTIVAAIAVLAISIAVCYGQRTLTGSGKTVTDTRSTGVFNAISNRGSIHVDVYPASKSRVDVSGFENLVEAVETEVKNGTLHVQFKDDVGDIRNSNIHVTIYTPGVSRVSHAGSGDITVHRGAGVLVREAMLAGSGDISLDQSEAPELRLSVAGSGAIRARAARAVSVKANVTGSGAIETAAVTRLTANVTGSGELHYWGKPQVSKTIVGSGNVVRH